MNIDKIAFSDRLKLLFGDARGSVAKLAAAAGVKHQVATTWYNAEYLPKFDNLLRIAEAKGCSLDWLMKGEGEPFPKRKHVGVTESRVDYECPLQFPAFSHAFANPHGNIDLEPLEHEYIEVPPHAELIMVDDDSMSPTTLPGQYVWIDRTSTIRQNDLVIARVKGHPRWIFKRVSYDKMTSMVVFSPVNQATPMEPIIIPRKHVKEIYLVVGAWYIGKRRPGRIIRMD